MVLNPVQIRELAHACLTLQQPKMLNKTNNIQLKQSKAGENKTRSMLSSRAIYKESTRPHCIQRMIMSAAKAFRSFEVCAQSI